MTSYISTCTLNILKPTPCFTVSRFFFCVRFWPELKMCLLPMWRRCLRSTKIRSQNRRSGPDGVFVQLDAVEHQMVFWWNTTRNRMGSYGVRGRFISVSQQNKHSWCFFWRYTVLHIAMPVSFDIYSCGFSNHFAFCPLLCFQPNLLAQWPTSSSS
jgi:hypothetical protein